MDESARNESALTPGSYSIDLSGETIDLLSERAVFRSKLRTLIVADTHFGKAATFRAAGIPIPSGTTAHDLARLSELLRTTSAERLVVLGDFLHARTGRTPSVMDQLHAWRREWTALTIELVIGNHDRSAGLPPAEWKLGIHPETLHEPPFIYAHHPLEHAHGYTLCGHLHPAYALRDRLARSETMRCFWFKARYGVLPSFGSFTGSMRIQPGNSDLVFLAGPRSVIPVPQGITT